MLLAEVAAQPSDLSAAAQWIGGLLGVLGAVALLLTVAKLFKDVFGRTPPLSTEIANRENLLRLEIQQLSQRLDQHKQEVNERFLSLNIERTRNLESLHEKINAVAQKLERLSGKIDALHS